MTAQAPLRPPDAGTVFARRAARFAQLAQAPGPLAGYLSFLQRVSEAQHEALHGSPAADDTDIGSWREPLLAMAERLRPDAMPQVREALDRALAASQDEADAWTAAMAQGEPASMPAQLWPLIGAALQVRRHAFAAALGGKTIAQASSFAAQPRLCPVCGAAPVASIIRSGTGVEGLRYLHCGLCGSEWNYVRIACTQCETTKGISYYAKDGDERTKAESCEACRGYVKIFAPANDPDVDPIADDIASIELDVLMGDAGFRRMAYNPLFSFG